MNNNNFGDSEYVYHGTGYQINAAGGTVNNTVYHGTHGIPIEVRCWRSLAFEEMEKRFHDIDAAQTGTCEWLSQHETYGDWVKTKRGLLWIKGKPGSGKSTLLRYVLNKEKKRVHIADKPLILSFFFHGRGTDLQRTLLGFYRLLLYQLHEIPDALSDVINTFKERCETVGEVGEKWQWHPKELCEFFESSLPKALKLRPVCLLVDALDECGEEEATGLARGFKRLLDRLQSNAYKPFHICFTCRPYPILALDSVFEICVERENETDISNFVRYQLSELKPKILPTIRDLITERANGVFLWASLTVKQILSLNLKATKLEQMEDAILRVPQELDDLYCQLIKGMGSDSLRLIQCVCVAMQPLSIDALRWAMVIKTKPPYQSLQECQNSPDYQPVDESMKKKLQILSHGLIEVTSNKTVQFIHQTVKDFFVEKGLLMLKRPDRVPDGISESDFAVGMAHHELSRICVRRLAMEPNNHVVCKLNHRGPDILLSEYAATEWVVHVQQSEQRGILQDDVLQDNLLDCFAWLPETVPRLCMWLYSYKYEGGGFCSRSCLSEVAVRYGLTGLFQAMLRRTKSIIEEKDEVGGTPLKWAAKNGHGAIARLPLGYGADIEANDEYGQTALSDAAMNGHEGIIRLLLEHGADISTKSKGGWTPLFGAAASGHEGIVRLLLKYGADISTKDKEGRTPLYHAAMSGHEGIVRLLLEYGAACHISVKDSLGRTPLLLIAKGQSILQLLLEHGAACDINVKVLDGNGRLHEGHLWSLKALRKTKDL